MDQGHTIKQRLSEWGNYLAKDNVLYLYDNAYLEDKKLIETLRELKAHKIKIQLDLFT